jgi:hypothetical protein
VWDLNAALAQEESTEQGVAINGVKALARCVGAGVSTSWISPGTIDEPALELFTTSVLGEGVSVISIGAGASAGWNSVRAIDETGLGAAASVIIAARSSAVCTGSGALARWICSGAHCKAAIGAGAEGKTALGVGAQGSTELGEGAQGNTAIGEGAPDAAQHSVKAPKATPLSAQGCQSAARTKREHPLFLLSRCTATLRVTQVMPRSLKSKIDSQQTGI